MSDEVQNEIPSLSDIQTNLIARTAQQAQRVHVLLQDVLESIEKYELSPNPTAQDTAAYVKQLQVLHTLRARNAELTVRMQRMNQDHLANLGISDAALGSK